MGEVAGGALGSADPRLQDLGLAPVLLAGAALPAGLDGQEPGDAVGHGDQVDADSILAVDDVGFGEADERLLVAGLLDQLDERSRTVIELRVFERLGQDEIAERLGVSQSYLSRLLRKILADLRDRLDEQQDQDPPSSTRPR